MAPAEHLPAMDAEATDLLRPVGPGLIVDATFGGGGHTRSLLAAIPGVQILALDRDPEAVNRAGALGPSVSAVYADFRNLSEVAESEGVGELDGVLFDLGLSSLQLDDPARGFSYRVAGPLDMRLDQGQPFSASEVVNELPQAELANIIGRFGEERFARPIAREIVAARPIQDTVRLAEVVSRAVPASARRRRHPARKTFQALRIYVNDELEALRSGLDAAISLLRPGGRLVAISYHSLEDRIVKRRLAEGAGLAPSDPDLVEPPDNVIELRLLTRRPLRPTAEEVAQNRRARSARLRAAERLVPDGGDAA